MPGERPAGRTATGERVVSRSPGCQGFWLERGEAGDWHACLHTVLQVVPVGCKAWRAGRSLSTMHAWTCLPLYFKYGFRLNPS